LAKGIRVNLLAKELGIESKLILQKLKDEGLGDKAPNHMSTLPLGLAESVREWFSGAGGGTAVETAPHVDLATKTKTVRSKKKKESAEGEKPSAEPGEGSGETLAVEATMTAVAEPPPPAPPSVEEPPAPPKRKRPAARAKAPAAPEAEPAVEPSVAPPPPAAPVAPPAPPAAAAKPAAAVPPPAPPAPAGVEHIRPPRPTVTLASRAASQLAPEVRKPVVQAPQLTSLEPAKIQGPRVVRIEKQEAVEQPHAPRAPRPAETTGVTPAGTRAGRGVKTADEDEEDTKKKAAGKKGGSLSSRRRGVDGRRGEAMEKLKEFTDADLIARRDALNAAASSRNVFDTHLRQIERRGTHAVAKPITQRGEPVTVEEPITVRSLSAALGVKTNEVQSRLMKSGVTAAINQTLDREVAQNMALEFGIELRIAKQATLEEALLSEIEARVVDPAKLAPRPPVVTILGHVDHGKTSLLDNIRKANVAAGEAGGITQHTAAWMVQLGEKRVTFIDTPGHQAFTSMRARGANMTDVVVLVVSAAEGVQPQTVESINHARAAGVPIIVALNKMDRADANPDMVLGQLAKEGLNPIEYGGDTEVVRTSATTGLGIPQLIELLDLQSQVMELKADPTAPARGSVIESRMDEGLGPVATVLVQNGTLKVGDIGLAGPGFGRIRSLVNDRGEMIREAGPSTPVVVSGLSQLPTSGDKFYALDDNERARAIAEERQARERQTDLGSANRVTLDTLFDSMKAEDVKTINLIIKGDVQGSIETLAKTVTESNTDEVRVRVIHGGVGGINESDV